MSWFGILTGGKCPKETPIGDICSPCLSLPAWVELYTPEKTIFSLSLSLGWDIFFLLHSVSTILLGLQLHARVFDIVPQSYSVLFYPLFFFSYLCLAVFYWPVFQVHRSSPLVHLLLGSSGKFFSFLPLFFQFLFHSFI